MNFWNTKFIKISIRAIFCVTEQIRMNFRATVVGS